MTLFKGQPEARLPGSVVALRHSLDVVGVQGLDPEVTGLGLDYREYELGFRIGLRVSRRGSLEDGGGTAGLRTSLQPKVPKLNPENRLRFSGAGLFVIAIILLVKFVTLRVLASMLPEALATLNSKPKP